MTPSERPVDSVRGVVLAGGDSTRFGATEDKALARVGSEPILNSIVNVLAQATHRAPVVAVRTRDQQTRYAREIDRTDIRFVFDTPAYEGPVAGLVAAATALDCQWLFCCGCDMPLLASTAVRWLAAQRFHAELTSQQPADAVAVEHPTGVIEPLHTLYRRESVLGASKGLPRSAGPRTLLSQLDHVHTVSTADAPEQVPLEPSLTNVNTRDELAAIRNRG